MPAALLSVQARLVLLHRVGQTVYHTPLTRGWGLAQVIAQTRIHTPTRERKSCMEAGPVDVPVTIMHYTTAYNFVQY